MKLLKAILRRKLLLLCLIVVFITSNAQNISYVAEHKSFADKLSEQFGIPSSVILAVAMVESSSGSGKAAKRLNNHFGIVGKNNLKATKGIRSRYKQYDSAEESYYDFCRMISQKKFYAQLKDNDDLKAWVKAISKTGYSEKPQVWEKNILNTISTNRL